MTVFTKTSAALVALLFIFTGFDSAFGQSRISGKLDPLKITGPCGWDRRISTDNAVNRVMGLWFLMDRLDTVVSSRGLELMGGGGKSFPNSFVTPFRMIPGTDLVYTSNYKFGEWDKKGKKVNMLKQAWVYRGWGTSSQIACYGAWVGRVSYK